MATEYQPGFAAVPDHAALAAVPAGDDEVVPAPRPGSERDTVACFLSRDPRGDKT